MKKRSTNRLAARLMAVLAVALLVVACSRDNRPDPSPITLELAATAQVNPDANGRPSPVLVRVYELRAPGVFESADFFALLEQDRSVLADDLINRWEYQLEPGERRRVDASFQASSGHIGVIAAYRNIEEATWRVVEPIESGRNNAFVATIDALRLEIERQR